MKLERESGRGEFYLRGGGSSWQGRSPWGGLQWFISLRHMGLERALGDTGGGEVRTQISRVCLTPCEAI